MVAPITKSRPRFYSTGELAELSQTHIENIRYFERIGLIPKAGRMASGHRRFGEEHLRRLIFIRRARDMGFSQDQVRALIALSDGTPNSCAEIKSIAETNLRLVREKIAGLKRLEHLLAETSAKCRGNRTPACPLIEVLLQ